MSDLLLTLMGLTTVVPLHLGALHPVERLLVLTVAFGPFVVLGLVVFLSRRRAIAEEQAEEQAEERAGQDAPGS
jgi:hypothetical protein